MDMIVNNRDLPVNKKGKNPRLHKTDILMMSVITDILTISMFLSCLWIFIFLYTFENKILEILKKIQLKF